MRQRSFFGPLLLIAAGVVWLLISAGVIPAENLWALGHIAPYLLMGLGLVLILRARWSVAGWIVSFAVVAGAFLAVLFAPQLGWNKGLPWNIGGDFTGAVQGSGRIKTETRKLGDLLGVSVEYPAEVVIRQSGSNSVEIEAEDNLLRQLSTEIRDGTLYIENGESDWSKRVRPSKPVRITITVKELQMINFPSAGKLHAEGLETEELKVTLSGAGDITLNKLNVQKLVGTLSGAGNIQADGEADEITLVISGFGNFEAPELTSLKADLRITGAGDATVRVSNDLTARISGAGTVNYYGSPKVVKEISGAGSVRQAGQ